MKKTLIHISDLHYQPGQPETYGAVINALMKDIINQVQKRENTDVFLVFSGDVVKEGDQEEAYADFLANVASKLKAIGIDQNRTICVPGNHDIARSLVRDELVVHEGIIAQITSEDLFHKHARGQKIFQSKFSKYATFSKQFSAFDVGANAMGHGWDIGGNVGIYCLNSAIFSSGGLTSVADKQIADFGRLAVDTRGLHQWLQDNDFRTRIVVMHHPLDWLCEWSRTELTAILGKDVDLLLTGHTHEQSSYIRSNSVGQFAHCLAPALYTKKKDPLGYALISLDEDGALDSIHYRQWAASQTFVTGTLFSQNDSGTVELRRGKAETEFINSGTLQAIRLPITSSSGKQQSELAEQLKIRLRCALKSFSTQPIVFVDPVLSDHSETTSQKLDEPKPTYDALTLLRSSGHILINAPVQFGLTCLARYMAWQALKELNQTWLYIDAVSTKPHRQAIGESVTNELAELGVEMASVDGIIVDSIRASDKDGAKLVKKLAEFYPGVRLICMRTNDRVGNADSFSEATGVALRHAFLWSMARSAIRKVVSDYIYENPIGDEDALTARLAADFEMMNIHRTPLNCLTLLKVSEIQFEDSPINRTEMINRVLHLLFNVDVIPAYKSRPDLKDCEFVIGYFCEQIIRTGQYQFLKEKFISSIEAFCKKNYLDLDIHVVFDVLFMNNIIVRRYEFYEFRFSYWVLYFSAQRMYHSREFATYIYEDMRYANFPEIIEFYTGINRAMQDALEVLSKDLRRSSDEFEHRIALPEDFDMFSTAQWIPSAAGMEQMKTDISNGVQTSNLPESVKDQYADRDYDRSRPYSQEVSNILSENSYSQMLQTMRAGAKALRNSDYVSTTAKTELLADILAVWERAATAILVIVPALAKEGVADFDDVRYVLDGTFGDNIENRFIGVLQVIPQNIVSYYQEDLFSHKMAPLLSDALRTEASKIRKHLLALVIIKNRPKKWSSAIKDYVTTLPKNSFYLLDVYKYLRTQYQYGYATDLELAEIETLIRMCAAKHFTGAKEPGAKMIENLKGKLTVDDKDPVPERKIGPDGALLSQQGNEGGVG